MECKQYNIVLIEDNKSHSDYIVSILEKEGFSVKTFFDGKSAIKYLKHPDIFPDAILTNNYLPDIEGTRIIEYFTKADYLYAFIILTGSNSIELAVNAMKLGALNYIAKSLNLKDELGLLVRKTIAYNQERRHKNELEYKLQENEELFRRHYQNLPIPTFTWKYESDEFVLLECNEAARIQTDNRIDEYVGMKASKVFKQVPAVVEHLFDCLHSKQVIQTEGEYTFQTTQLTRYLKTTYVSISDVLVMVHTEDITERKRAEKKLVETYSQLKTIFETIPAAINIIDQDFRVIECNEQMLKIFRLESKDDIIGQKCCKHCALNELDACEASQLGYFKHAVMVSETSFLQDERIYKIISNTIFKAGGIPAGTVEVIVDITTEKKAEEQFRELNAMKDKLFSIIGHDLRSPIGSMKKLVKYMQKSVQNQDTKRLSEMLAVIQSTANSTYYLLENLLSWAKSQNTDISFHPETCNLYGICEEVFSLFAEQAVNKEIQLHNTIDEGFDIVADSNMISTVLRNLVNNAIKFTKPGKNIYVTAKRSEGVAVMIIKDEGVGIDNDLIDDLFTPSGFYTSYGTEGEKGSGLGLLLCKEFVDKHGGEIIVESKLGEGTSFYVSLPQNI